MKYSTITLSVILLFLLSCNSPVEDSESVTNSKVVAPEPVIEYGFNADTFLVIKNEIQSGQSLGKILSDFGVSYAQIDKIARKTRRTEFDVRYLKAGHPYAMFCVLDTGGRENAQIFVYEEDKINYVCLLYTSPSPRDRSLSRMPSSA